MSAFSCVSDDHAARPSSALKFPQGYLQRGRTVCLQYSVQFTIALTLPRVDTPVTSHTIAHHDLGVFSDAFHDKSLRTWQPFSAKNVRWRLPFPDVFGHPTQPDLNGSNSDTQRALPPLQSRPFTRPLRDVHTPMPSARTRYATLYGFQRLPRHTRRPATAFSLDTRLGIGATHITSERVTMS